MRAVLFFAVLFLVASCAEQSQITSFEECVAAGYPVMESYPEQCRTPDGRSFVNRAQSMPEETVEEQPEVMEEPDDMQRVDETPVDELTYEQDQMMDEPPLTLTATKTVDGVQLEWTPYEGEFVSYKVIRSITNANPTYPGESLLKTIPDVEETSYLDRLYEGGISYYAVAAIGPLNTKSHSNPVKIEYPDPKETPDQEIELSAQVKENGVELTWTKYDGPFMFYKVVTTTEHPYPKYPDDDTIKTIGYADETTYLDYAPDPGVNYYAITIVRPDKSKFTSGRVRVDWVPE